MPNHIAKFVNDSVTFAVLVTRSGEGLAGLSPTLEIRRGSDGLYFDFDATEEPFWVAAGGRREGTLDVSPWQDGYYGFVFDHAEFDEGNADEYTAIYRNHGDYAFTEIEIATFADNPMLDVTLIRQILANDQDLECTGTGYRHRVYGDGGSASGVVHEKTVALNGNTEERRDP